MSIKHYHIVDGERIEWTAKEASDWAFNFTTPIWDSVVRDLDICTNCWCTDCGCCIGCGEINADIDYRPHGYACVM